MSPWFQCFTFAGEWLQCINGVAVDSANISQILSAIDKPTRVSGIHSSVVSSVSYFPLFVPLKGHTHIT